ncbi:hypothetical protein DFJ73DRAFT_436796 [Zopfochytrium polystomum]|nr:hypothetical protein DFJ73DRAFT_436796 [Zopfochytrium polystomum]
MHRGRGVGGFGSNRGSGRHHHQHNHHAQHNHQQQQQQQQYAPPPSPSPSPTPSSSSSSAGGGGGGGGGASPAARANGTASRSVGAGGGGRGGGGGGGGGGSGPVRRDFGTPSHNNNTHNNSTNANANDPPHPAPAAHSAKIVDGAGGRTVPHTPAAAPFPAVRGKWSNGPPKLNNAATIAASPAALLSSLMSASSTPSRDQLDRFTLLTINLVGCKVTADLKDGHQYVGILHAIDPSSEEIGAVLRLAKRVDAGKPTSSTIEKLVISPKDLLAISAYSVDLSSDNFERGEKLGFLTDSTIGAQNGEFGRERELRKWEPSPGDPDTAGSLEDEPAAGAGKWDQFHTNERLFGVTTDFKEELYTTQIDRSAPDFKRKEAEARRLAREIENDTKMADNIHILEERNAVLPNDGLDEEERYSAVVRQPGKYVPPGARGTASKQAGALLRKKQDPSVSITPTVPPAVLTPLSPTNATPSQSTSAAESTPETTHPVLSPFPVERGISDSSSSATEVTSLAEEKSTTQIIKAQGHSTKNSGVAHTATKVPTKSTGGPSESPMARPADRDSIRKAELLSKLLSKKPGDASLRDPSKTVGEAWQHFHSFANQERKHSQRQHRDKAQIINELKNFSKDFKINLPVPEDIAPLLSKKSSDPATDSTPGVPRQDTTTFKVRSCPTDSNGAELQTSKCHQRHADQRVCISLERRHKASEHFVDISFERFQQRTRSFRWRESSTRRQAAYPACSLCLGSSRSESLRSVRDFRIARSSH